MIRKMEGTDASAVWQIITRSLGYDCGFETVQRRICELADDSHYLSLVWANEDSGQVEGFLHACRYETLHRSGGWDVISLAVMPEAQGTGVGTELLACFEGEARRLGGTYVRLNSRVERTAAHAFYERRGYTCDKTQKRFIKVFDR